MKLKPIPRRILITVSILATVYLIVKLMTGPKVDEQSSADTLPKQSLVKAEDTTISQNRFDSLKTILEKGVIRVAVQSPSKPFYSEENGTSTGFNVEFMKLLFAQTEFTEKHAQIIIDTDYKLDTYEEVPKSLLKTDPRGSFVVDIAIDGLTFSDNDLDGVVYSIPYVSDFGYSLITASNSNIKSIKDLRGKTIGVLQGDPDVKAYVEQHFPESKIAVLSDASVNGIRDWINRAIKSGEADAVIYDYPFAVSEISGTDLKFAVSKLQDSEIRYKIGVRKGDDKLLKNINLAIRKTKDSPEYLALLQKYFVSKNTSAVSEASGKETIYIVKNGDTLSTIAQDVLGNKLRYPELESRNNLPNPNLIRVGQRLVIPKT